MEKTIKVNEVSDLVNISMNRALAIVLNLHMLTDQLKKGNLDISNSSELVMNTI